MSRSRDVATEIRVDWLLRATALVFLAHLVQGGAMKLPAPGGLEDAIRWTLMAAMAIGVVAGGRLLRFRGIWIATAVAFHAATIRHWDLVGNHQFVLGYFALALALACDADAARMQQLVRLNGRWMLIAIMAFAVLQKAASEPFRDGSFVATLLAQGELLGPLFALCEACSDAIASNGAIMANAAQSYPGSAPPVSLVPPLPGISGVTGAVTGLTLGIEVLIALLFLWPRARALRLPVLFVFVATLALMRPEYVFGSWLACVGLWLCDDSDRALGVGFAVVLVAYSALSVTRIV